MTEPPVPPAQSTGPEGSAAARARRFCSSHPVGRGELVRLLALGVDDTRAACLLGYEMVPAPPAPASERPVEPPVSSQAPSPPAEAARGPTAGRETIEEAADERMPLWRAVGPICTPLGPEARAIPEWLAKATPCDERALSARTMREPAPRPLIPRARLGPVLRRALLLPAEGTGLDEPKLVRELSRLRPLGRVPRVSRPRWPLRLQVYWDQSQVLGPVRQDQFEAVAWLRRWRGEQGLEEIIVDGCGGEAWYQRVGHGDAARVIVRPVRRAEPGTSILALSDLGCADGDLRRQRYWRSLRRKAESAGACCRALVPCPGDRWVPELASSWEAIEWERARLLGPGVGGGSRRSQADRDADVARLLLLLCPAVRVDWTLLREARRRVPGRPLDVGTELDVAAHPFAVGRCGLGFVLEYGGAKELRRQLRNDPDPELRQGAADVLRQVHKGLGLLLRAEELLATHDPQARAGALQLLRQYARLRAERTSRDSVEDGYLLRLEARQSTEDWDEEVLAVLWALRHREGDHFDASPPPGLDARRVLWALDDLPPRHRWCVVQRGAELLLIPRTPADSLPTGGCGCVLLEFGLHWPMLEVEGQGRDGVRALQRVQLGSGRSLPLSWRDASFESLRLRGDAGMVEAELWLESMPEWAQSFERDGSGLWVRTSVEPLSRVPWPRWAATVEKDSYGLVATPDLASGVLTRFRWIPPGRFLMGSPDDEPGRFGAEGPQHWVTLTRGFWLAETPCTQAEWQAVMGQNPSGFNGERRPVEKVSWEDCQRFCSRLRERFPGLDARLPSEAEWEYACRAGTASAFNDGSSCTEPEGMDPALAKLGWFRENSDAKTHPVAELEPNAWGLYDMHGNVWEWCQDTWTDHYPAEEQTDPVATTGAVRVFRGGGWGNVARHCRSAYRLRGPPVVRRSVLGLRLAAGQLGEPSQGAEPQDKASAGQRAGGPRPGGGKAKGSKGGRKR